MQPRTILELSAEESFEFLMQDRQYCNLELPEYFNFQRVLDYCKDVCKDVTDPTLPDKLDGVNLELLINKDGRYGVRPITIANPFLYTFLAQTICGKEAWSAILECFEAFSVPTIKVCSIPLFVDKKSKEAFLNSTTILNWWQEMEQHPMELSLQYRYMFMTDITNCFGQILPQSIDWALSRKDTDKNTDKNHTLAEKIIRIIESMQSGRKLGIPQGSVLYNFISEIVLGYADLLLYQAIESAGIKAEYKILRYVDDYRIFCNDRGALEKISYLLQHTLESLNFRLNTSKSKISNNIIVDAVKAEKAFYIFNTPIMSKSGCDFNGFQRHLYFIYEFGHKFPNCGQLKVLLSDFDRRLTEFLKPRKTKNVVLWEEVNLDGDTTEQPKDLDKELAGLSGMLAEIEEEARCKSNKNVTGQITLADDCAMESESKCSKGVDTLQKGSDERPHFYVPKIKERIMPMVAILVQTAAENVTSAHYALRVVSKLLATVTDEAEKRSIIGMVYNRLRNLPNSGYLQLWLQVLTGPIDDESINDYDNPLCRVANNSEEGMIELWNNSWLNVTLASELPTSTVCDQEKQKAQRQIIRITPRTVYDDPSDLDDLEESLTDIDKSESLTMDESLDESLLSTLSDIARLESRNIDDSTLDALMEIDRMESLDIDDSTLDALKEVDRLESLDIDDSALSALDD